VKNTLRVALKAGRPTFGSWLQFGHTGVAEIMAKAGFDWLAIDLEHSAIDVSTAFALIQVVELAGCAPLVRLSGNDPVQAKHVMDAGAWGIIVPSVQSAAEARKAVAAVKYPPEGTRGVGLGRAHGYGTRFAEYVRECSEGSVVIPMIEQKEGVDRVEEIVDVEGVDAVFIGPYDLSASYGVPGELNHPLVVDAMRRVVETARAKGKAAGIHVVHPPVAQVADRLSEGFSLIAYGGDMLFLTPAAIEAGASLRDLRVRESG
jgi:2-keto-3-deoxy-L-rhamnonate aldolase RhmA